MTRTTKLDDALAYRGTHPPQRSEGVIPLCAAEATSAAIVGTKAANLARLLAAGFPVPDGIVLDTSSFMTYVPQSVRESYDPVAAVRQAPLPEPVAEALRTGLDLLGEGPLAVRSSGVAEDLPGASFAGQYTTVLGVEGFEAVADAVRECWASAFRPHLMRYQAARGLVGHPVAVLIQHLVDADAAGVAFTANPVTGNREETVVSAVRGLGERLVSGQASPDEWVVRGRQASHLSTPEDALSPDQVLAVAGLARRVEAFFGSPQDIEWAFRKGELYLLQARPITALAGEGAGAEGVRDITPPPGFWQRADSHYPRPLSPFAASVLLPAANHGFRRMCTEFGLLTETVEEREIGGWVYLRAVPLGGKDRPSPPDWLLRLLLLVLPSLRARMRDCTEAVQTDKAGRYIEQWHAEWKSELEARLAALRDADLAAMSDTDLDGHAADVRTLLEESQEIHMLLNQSLNLLLADFAFTCRDLLGWEEEKAFDMLIGLSETSSAPARALRQVAQRVRENRVLSELLDADGPGNLDEMLAADAAFSTALSDYHRVFGSRTIGYEVMDPSLAERPELTLSLMRDQVRLDYDPDADSRALQERRQRTIDLARRSLAEHRAEERLRFEHALRRAESAYPVREEHGFHDTMMPLALVRYAALEVGRRLAARQQIAARDDVFFLGMDEARQALRAGAAQHDRVERRRVERSLALAHPGPAVYGKAPVGPPSLAPLPPDARRVHEAVLWAYERIFATSASARRQDDSSVLRGIAASAGAYTGPARIVRDEADFHRIRAGDVLVCPITSPVWSVLFPSVGALVTDAGGFLSHSAIIAREYRIPAVVATGSATAVLNDGELVSVDGGAGTITTRER